MTTGNKKLFLLDAMALIFRAHFAFIRNPRINSKGINTSAVFGFTNSLLEILEKYKPTHLGIAFDLEGPTFRHEEFSEYKANRDERPEDITIAIPLVKKLAEAFNIPILAVEGFEADDVMGTLAKKAAREGFEVYLMTPDKDFAQLVEDNRIMLYRPGRMGKPSEIWGEKEVKAKFGIERIDQVIDIQGLMGDSIDNIPGIPGIGPKTAEKLIKQYDTIQNLIEHSGELKGKQKERVEEFADQAILSKRLARIKVDVPIDFEPDKLICEEPDRDMIRQLFAELEFRALGKRVLGEQFDPKEARKNGQQQDLFSDIPKMQETVEEEENKTIDDVKHEYHLVNTAEDRVKLAKAMEAAGSFAIDTETSGLNPHVAQICGISISMKPHEAYYVAVPASGEEAKEVLAPFKPVLENKQIMKIGQNLKYDIIVFRNAGIHVQGTIFDTMIAHYLLEPEMRHNLDMLSEKYLHYTPISIETLIGKKGKGKKQENMQNLDPEKIRDYACEDADVALQLKEYFAPKIREGEYTKLFEEIESPLVYVLADVEREGIKVDKQNLSEYSRELAEEILGLEQEVYKLANMEFNLNSPKQLGEVLFDHLKLDPKAKKTRKTKQYSTSEDVLAKLARHHDICGKILDYRSLQKLKSTYVDALPLMIDESTGRIHSSFQQTVAATGRLSSTNPNLQNIPIRTEKGRYIRKAFVPRNEDYTLLSADYSQIELRLIAAISKDEGMMQAFKEGEDIHTTTAAKVFNCSVDEVTAAMRRSAKTVNFGIIYGISAFGLSERLDIPRKEAKDIIDAYFEKFPGIRKYMDDTISFARDHGFVKTLLGRRRPLRDINSRNANQRGYAERNAINSPIQGTAADMIKIAMVNIHEQLEKRKLQSRMILQVHDELVFDAHKNEVDELKEMVEDKMKHALDIEVPIIVEMGTGENWLEAH